MPTVGSDAKTPNECAVVRVSRIAASGLTDVAGVIGTECVGVVESIPEEHRSRFPVGSRVAVWPHISCGVCDACESALPSLCTNARVLGVKQLDSVLAERVRVPASNLFRVPDTVEDERAVFACATAVACHAVRAVDIRTAAWVTVLGDSVEAMLTAQIASGQNESVRLLGRDPQRIALCEKWGIRSRPITEAGAHADQGVVFVCPSPDWSDASELFSAALGIVKHRGSIVLASSPAWPTAPGANHNARSVGPAQFDIGQLSSREVRVIGACGGRMIDAIMAIESRRVNVDPLVEGRCRLADCSGPIGALGANSLRLIVAA